MKCCCEATVRLQLDCRAAFYFRKTYVRKVSPYQGEDLICSSYFIIWGTGLLVGKRNVAPFSHPGFYQLVHKMELEQNNAFLSNSSLPTCTPNDRHTWAISTARCLYITGKKKVCGKKRKDRKENVLPAHFWVLMLLHLTFSWQPYTHFFKRRGVVLWQKYITAAALSRDWTTGIM